MEARYSTKHKVHDGASMCNNGQCVITPILDWNFRHNMRIATDMGLQSPYHLDVAALLVDEFIEKLSLVDEHNPTDVLASPASNSQGLNDIVICDPPRVKSKGRPKKLTRIKFGIEISLSQKEKKKRTRRKVEKKERYKIIGSSSLVQKCSQETIETITQVETKKRKMIRHKV